MRECPELSPYDVTLKNENPLITNGLFYVKAEEEGFEPPDRVNGLRFSRPVQ